jgi:hypothetical protein
MLLRIMAAYQLFDLPHGYKAEDREAVLGWFDCI